MRAAICARVYPFSSDFVRVRVSFYGPKRAGGNPFRRGFPGGKKITYFEKILTFNSPGVECARARARATYAFDGGDGANGTANIGRTFFRSELVDSC